MLNPEDDVKSPSPAASPSPAFSGATAVGTDVPFTSEISALETGFISIPAVATTAQFVAPGGANGTGAGSPTAAPTAAPSSSEFPGAANKVKGAVGGMAIGLGMALML